MHLIVDASGATGRPATIALVLVSGRLARRSLRERLLCFARRRSRHAGILPCLMADESRTPDLVERWRRVAEAVAHSDFDVAMSYFAPDSTWDALPLGISFKGIAGIRSFLEEWIGSYDDYHQELVEGYELGNDVVFAVNRQDARLAGTTRRVRELWSFTITWRAAMVERVIARNDIDEARAVAERLAEERV